MNNLLELTRIGNHKISTVHLYDSEYETVLFLDRRGLVLERRTNSEDDALSMHNTIVSKGDDIIAAYDDYYMAKDHIKSQLKCEIEGLLR